MRTQIIWCWCSTSLDTGEANHFSWGNYTYNFLYSVCVCKKSWLKRHVSPQAASVSGQRQWKEWTVSHHLCLWDLVYSWMQTLLPRCKLNSLRQVMIKIFEHHVTRSVNQKHFSRRVIISGITLWWSSGKATAANSRTPTSSRATAPSASRGPFNARRNLTLWDTNTAAQPETQCDDLFQKWT